MLSRLGLGEDQAEMAGSSTVLIHESVVYDAGRQTGHQSAGFTSPVPPP